MMCMTVPLLKDTLFVSLELPFCRFLFLENFIVLLNTCIHNVRSFRVGHLLRS